MPDEKSDLLTDVDLLCWNAEILAMKNLHAIELPLCGFLTRLSAKDCVDLLVSIFSLNYYNSLICIHYFLHFS